MNRGPLLSLQCLYILCVRSMMSSDINWFVLDNSDRCLDMAGVIDAGVFSFTIFSRIIDQRSLVDHRIV